MVWFFTLCVLGIVFCAGGFTGQQIERRKKIKVGTPSASCNIASRKIACSNRECDWRSRDGEQRGGKMNESYGKEWVEVRLMVHEDGEVHCIGGERVSDTGDAPYRGAERLKKHWGIELGRPPKKYSGVKREI